VTNGLLASVEHRVVTNLVKARMSVAALIRPNTNCRIGPATTVMNDDTSPPKFRDFTWDEFTEAYEATAGNRKAMLDFFKIHQSKSS
jgi:2'-deoxymugineic-acid 2'-dioxygenase/mugineic-acid 3-dioxygenase